MNIKPRLNLSRVGSKRFAHFSIRLDTNDGLTVFWSLALGGYGPPISTQAFVTDRRNRKLFADA
jgi:hypothetical protein